MAEVRARFVKSMPIELLANSAEYTMQKEIAKNAIGHAENTRVLSAIGSPLGSRKNFTVSKTSWYIPIPSADRHIHFGQSLI
jgi:hypothetical protein